MKIYTKTGDKGETGLFGGQRVWKDDLRIEAYGTVDELNAVMGVALVEVKSEEISQSLSRIQNELFLLGSDLATPFEEVKVKIKRIDNVHIKILEDEIDLFEEKLEELRNFILPGGSKGSAYLHLARAICRRAERHVTSLAKSIDIGSEVVIYLNRLSDLLFVLSRYENKLNKIPDTIWKI